MYVDYPINPIKEFSYFGTQKLFPDYLLRVIHENFDMLKKKLNKTMNH